MVEQEEQKHGVRKPQKQQFSNMAPEQNQNTPKKKTNEEKPRMTEKKHQILMMQQMAYFNEVPRRDQLRRQFK